ncbi:MAG: hypothetical protein IJJ64_16305, partial [Butyrivibrio sp.]|nr:hypothetical protein [Butyrivibrio sp.]
MANKKNDSERIPLIKTVSGMSALSYLALLILFVISIAVVTTQMMNITKQSVTISGNVEAVMDDMRVFEVDMRIIDNDGFAMAA